jgi:hypothetical protein
MTLQEAKSIARHLGLTLRLLRSGNYRVNFRDGNETTAYYTDDLSKTPSIPRLRWPVSERCKRCAVQGWNGDLASAELKPIIEKVALTARYLLWQR